MTRFEKRLQKFLSRPESLKYKEIELILLGIGFEMVEAKGSHKKFKHFGLERDLIIPVHGNDCKNFYKKYVSKIVKSQLHLE